MRARTHTCKDCAHWRRGAPADVMIAAPARSDSDVGACEDMPPQFADTEQGLRSFQPLTHHSRSCSSFLLAHDADGPDGPDDGEPKVVPIAGDQTIPPSLSLVA